METKICKKCKLALSVDCFCKNKRSKDGYNTVCKVCSSSDMVAGRIARNRLRRAFQRSYCIKYGLERVVYDNQYYKEYHSFIEKYSPDTKIFIGEYTRHDINRQLESQMGRCWWCGAQCKKQYHIDHLIPLDRGGHNNPSNIVISCPHCNLSKSDKLPDEFCGRLF